MPLAQQSPRKLPRQNLANKSTLWIEPIHGWAGLKLKELWEYRELLYFLVWRDVKVRYKQAALGAAWAILQPLLTMLIFSLIFGMFAKVPSDGTPYPLFAFVALVPWNFFATSMNQSSNSVVGSANLITKVYFPRLAIPLASVLAGLVDFALAFMVLLAMMVYYKRVPTAHVLLVATVSFAGAVRGRRRRVLAFGDEREVPRRAIRGSVLGAVLDVRLADHLPKQHDPGPLPNALRIESDGRGGGRIPLGLARDQDCARTRVDRVGGGHDCIFGWWCTVFSADGSAIR